MLLHCQIIEGKVGIHGKSDVVLIHGTGSRGAMWQAQIDLLTDLGHRCFVIDLRGHGDSDEPQEPTDIAVHNADVLETVRHYGVRMPAIWIGHSLGAIISVTLAQEHPECFERIFAAGLPGRVLGFMAYFFKLFLRHSYDRIKSSGIHASWSFRPRTLIETRRHALEEICKNFKGLDFVTSPPVLHCPVHFAAGRFDPVAPCIYTARVHKAMPNSTFKIFEMGGHNFMDTHPKSFNKWLVDNLESKAASSSSLPS